MLNNKDIETLAVSAVRESITISNHLEGYISENDKEPSWDGSIIIYGNKKGNKSDIIGRVSVQVKGKKEKNHRRKEITYKMKVSDLRNYLNDGGCILFVVYINPNNMAKKIYYNALTPVELKIILKNTENQDNKNIRLKHFPTDVNKKDDILLNFYNNSNRQNLYNVAFLKLNQVKEMKNFENLVIPISSFSKIDPHKALLENDVYFYANTKDTTISIPVGHILKIVNTSNYIKCSISIDEQIYYEKIKIVRTRDEDILCIGESLKLIFKDTEDMYKISYESSNKARVLAKDLEFNLKMMEAGYFKIDDEKITIEKDKIVYENYDIEKLNQNLAFAKDVVKALDILGCEEDICFDELDEKDWDSLNILVDAFVYGKNIGGIKKLENPFSNVYVGKLKFYLYFEEIKSTNEYKVYNFFNKNLEVTIHYQDRKKEAFDISQFIILTKNDFLTASNIDFDKVVLDFKNVKHNNRTFSTANYYLLELLAAADIAEGKRKDKILEACEDFALWIKEAPDDELEDEIKTINLLQVYKRQRDLTDDEKDELYDIVENNSNNNQYMVGAYLLLGQQRQAERFFNKMSKDERNNFKEYPIYHFWN